MKFIKFLFQTLLIASGAYLIFTFMWVLAPYDPSFVIISKDTIIIFIFAGATMAACINYIKNNIS